jgi:S1-C subfamily serine protease
MRLPSGKWLAVVALVAALLGCSIPGSISEILTPTPMPTPTPTMTPMPTATLAPASTPPPGLAQLVQLEQEVIQVYESVSKGVVNITNRSYGYDFFFRPVPQEGSGSGIVYDKKGHIITNYHVIEDASELSVTLADDTTIPAEVVGVDPSSDLAVLKVDIAPHLLHPVPMGKSENLRVGQFVVAIGNPFGFEHTLTVGVISALGRVIESPDERFIGEVIQTDAAINPGNSGGPLLNLSGQIVGVNTAIFSPSQASAGIGFAVPASTVRRVVPALLDRGFFPHPWLGVSLFWNLTPERRQVLREAGMKVPVTEGVLILEAAADSPAERAGLRGGQEQIWIGRYLLPIGGDIITALNGEPVKTGRDLIRYIDTQAEVGETIQVTLWRDGLERSVAATLTERPR